MGLLVTDVNPLGRKINRIFVVNPEDSKRLVLQYAERGKLNIAWLASQLGENRQTVWNYVKGVREPQNPTIWTRMAAVLGLSNQANSELIDSARELALDVLTQSDDPELKARAANLIREISKKVSPN